MPFLRRLVRALDRYLLRKQDIRDFSAREECLLRLSVRNSSRSVQLADGTSIAHGEPVGELHWRNDHMPIMKGGRPDMRWARDFQRRLRITLQELAIHVQQESRWLEVKGFRGDNSFGGRQGRIGIPELFRRWGFELIAAEEPGLLGRISNFWGGIYVLLLFWAYSTSDVSTRNIQEIKGAEIWISREILLEKYGRRSP